MGEGRRTARDCRRGANVPNAKLLAKTTEAIVPEQPQPEPEYPQHLCLDKGCDNGDGRGACADHDYSPHIALIRDERPPRPKRHPARQWIAERTLAWLSKCRGILIRWEKKTENYLGLLKLACGLLRFGCYERLSTAAQ